jgi:hypothetical protein
MVVAASEDAHDHPAFGDFGEAQVLETECYAALTAIEHIFGMIGSAFAIRAAPTRNFRWGL